MLPSIKTLGSISPFVVVGLDSAIHAAFSILRPASMDARVKPAHDERKVFGLSTIWLS